MTRDAAQTRGLRRWIISLGLIAVLVVLTFLAVTRFFEGDTYLEQLEAAYEVLWKNTTQRQFTGIMREEPYLYIIPAGSMVLVSGWQLPREYHERAILT